MATTENKDLEKVTQGMVRADVPVDAAIEAVDDCIPYQVARLSGVDAKTTGATTVYTVPTGKVLIVTEALVIATAAASVSAGPSYGIGGNATSYNDLASGATVALTAAGKFIVHQPSTGSVRTAYAAGTAIKFNVTGAATGTTLTLTVDLIGYLLDA